MSQSKKLTKNAVLELMDEFVEVEQKIERADRAKQKGLDPLLAAHNDACKPILNRFEKTTAPLLERRNEIHEAVSGWLEQQGKDQVLESPKGAVAEQKTETKVGSRVINVEKFLAKAKSKGAAAWDCVSVAIAKAEKLLGKDTVDAISTKDQKTTVSRTLRVD